MEDQFEYFVYVDHEDPDHAYSWSVDQPYRIWRRHREGWDRTELDGGWEWLSPYTGKWQHLEHENLAVWQLPNDDWSEVQRSRFRSVSADYIARLAAEPERQFRYWARYQSREAWLSGSAQIEAVVRECFNACHVERTAVYNFAIGRWENAPWQVDNFFEPRHDVRYHLVPISLEATKRAFANFAASVDALRSGLNAVGSDVFSDQTDNEQAFYVARAMYTYEGIPGLDLIKDYLPASMYRRVGDNWEYFSLISWTWNSCVVPPMFRPLLRVSAERADYLVQNRREFAHYTGYFRTVDAYLGGVELPLEIRRKRDSPEGAYVERLQVGRSRRQWVVIKEEEPQRRGVPVHMNKILIEQFLGALKPKKSVRNLLCRIRETDLTMI